ncbi:MAG TPA: signal recognition particle-docking protein FtsY [Acidimicrobiales bacterium]|nr:signal recognition particle-docking protein FtsY [Acidimicrobiales bacterium]
MATLLLLASTSALIATVVAVALVLLAVVPLLVTRVRRGRSEPAPPQERPAAPVEVDDALATRIEGALAPAPAEPAADETDEVEEAEEAEEGQELELVAPVKPRFRDRLTKARSLFAGYVGAVLSRTGIDDQTWDDLEEALVRADVGVGLTTTVLDDLRSRVKSDSIATSAALLEALKADLKEALATTDRSLKVEPGETNVWLFVGVNGVGKTTTIGKIGYRERAAGRSVVMAAGDTFRAAAADQLELWSKRTGADLVRGAEGGDPASVIFDAIQRAAARHADLVLADTAGRLHTKVNLMEELKKVRRVAERPPGRVTEVLLVIDATTGQNGLIQAKEFADAVGVTGVVLTKLDGTAKGGIAIAIQRELGIPIKLVGLGETVDDLVEFDADEFVEALLAP